MRPEGREKRRGGVEGINHGLTESQGREGQEGRV